MSLIAALFLLANGGAAPAASFEAGGVRVDGTLVTGAGLQVKDLASGLLLVSGSVVEPLSAEISLSADGRTMTLSPGVRVTRTAAGYELSLHGPKRVALTLGGERHVLLAPLTVKAAAGGWDLGSGLVRAGQELAAAPDQDDVDSNLNKLNQSSQKIQKSMQPPPKQDPPPSQPNATAPPPPPAPRPAAPAAKSSDPERSGPRMPWNRAPGVQAQAGARKPGYFMFYSAFNPFVSAQAVGSETIRSQQHVSPIGP